MLAKADITRASCSLKDAWLICKMLDFHVESDDGNTCGLLYWTNCG